MKKELTNSEKRLAQYLGKPEVTLIQSFVDTTFVNNDIKMTAAKIYEALQGELNREDLSKDNFCGSLSCNVRGGYIVGIVGKRKVGYMRCERNEPVEKLGEALTISRGRGNRSSRAKPPNPPAKLVPAGASPLDDSGLSKAPEAKPIENVNIEKSVVSAANELQPAILEKQPAAKKAQRGFVHNHLWIDGMEYKVYSHNAQLVKFITSVLEGVKDDTGTIVCEGEKYSIPLDNKGIFIKYVTEICFSNNVGRSEPHLDDGSGLTVNMQLLAARSEYQGE